MTLRAPLLALAVLLAAGCGAPRPNPSGGGAGGGTPDGGSVGGGTGGGGGGSAGGGVGGSGGGAGGGSTGGTGGTGGGTPVPDAGTCGDGIKNPGETDIDCGGFCAAKCALGQKCFVPGDCASTTCVLQKCVECNLATQCPGTDTLCRARSCVNNACGIFTVDAGVAAGVQTAGDCRQNRCDGDGGLVPFLDLLDVPANDGNACTGEACSAAGVPEHPPADAGVACTQDGGTVCDGLGACVQCNGAAECPGTDTECRVRACVAHVCRPVLADAGQLLSMQTLGDCRYTQCDGDGGVSVVGDPLDLPADDGNHCTGEACVAGAAAHPFLDAGVACNQNGGFQCDGLGFCEGPPQVTLTVPGDGAAPVASTSIAVTFSRAMDPASLPAQTVAGACTGTVQVSADGFATCLAFSAAAPAMNAAETIATYVPAPGLLVNTAYKVKVTTAATSRAQLALAADFVHPTGFQTVSPNLCDGSLVISAVYGGGGNTGATYTHDFVELHNRGAAAVPLAGKSLQYASSAGTSWSALALTGTIPGGGYFLVQLASGGAVGQALPAPDQMAASPNLSATAGKVALMNTTTANPSNVCPPMASTLDFVGFGGANCFEGAAAAPAPSATAPLVRVRSGCLDTNDNAVDHAAQAAAPRNSASPAAPCGCVVHNESNLAEEADYCVVQFPLSLSLMVGATGGLVYGQVYELGLTEAAGSAGGVRAQLGIGPAALNPQYQAGWTWTNATFNVQSGNNDEYQAVVPTPALAGSYRYVYRMSLDDGVSWTYCDGSGAGSNASLRFDFADEPVLTVTP